MSTKIYDRGHKLLRKTEVLIPRPLRVRTAFQAGPAPGRFIFHRGGDIRSRTGTPKDDPLSRRASGPPRLLSPWRRIAESNGHRCRCPGVRGQLPTLSRTLQRRAEESNLVPVGTPGVQSRSPAMSGALQDEGRRHVLGLEPRFDPVSSPAVGSSAFLRGQGSGIRTRDLLRPRQALCQTELRPDGRGSGIRTRDLLLPKQALYPG